MWAAGDLRCQIPADAAASQLSKASGSTLPLLLGDGAQPPPEPPIKFTQHRRRLTETEVAAPPDEVDRQLLDDLCEVLSARAPRQLPNSRLEAGERLRCNAPPQLSSGGEAEAEELTDARFGDRALGCVTLSLRRFPRNRSIPAMLVSSTSKRCLLVNTISIARCRPKMCGRRAMPSGGVTPYPSLGARKVARSPAMTRSQARVRAPVRHQRRWPCRQRS
jgi:hypothetical protein